VVTRPDDSVPRLFAGCGTSLPEQDARNADRGNPRRFHRAAKWKKAMEGFFHGQPEQDARNADRGNPRRFHRAAKWKKAMEAIPFGTGFAHHTPGVLGKTGGLRPGL